METRHRLSVMVAVGMMGGALLLSGCGKKNQQAGGPPKMGPPEVAVVTVQQKSVAITTELPGRTSAFLVAEVRPQVNGIIQKRFFTEGADVKEGEVLYQIDPSTYQAAHASAKAALRKAEANLVPVRLKSERYKQLVAINAVSKQDYDDAMAALQLAEADVEAKKADMEAARINLAHTKVTAPISGRIGKSLVTTGALATANQATPLATIQQLSPMYVDVTQSISNLLRLKENLAAGQLKKDGGKQAKVKLMLENGAAYPLEGTLKFSDVTVDQGTGSVTLRTVFPNPKQLLLPGMYVRAVLEEGVSENAILVPQQAVTRDAAGNPTTLVVGVGEKVEPRVLKVSRTLGDQWLVTEGVKAGDRIIVEGIQKAKPGVAVKAVPFEPKVATQPQSPAAVAKK